MTDMSVLTDLEDGTLAKPTQLNELTSEKTETIKLSVDAALKLNVPIGSFDNKLSRTIFIQEFKKYKEITHLMPAPKDFNTETYIELNEAFMAIKEKIWDQSTTIEFGVYGNSKIR
ncbi:MAG: hypothetical protein ACERKD_19635 [Prolixibacteraceae bacterium]